MEKRKISITESPLAESHLHFADIPGRNTPFVHEEEMVHTVTIGTIPYIALNMKSRVLFL